MRQSAASNLPFLRVFRAIEKSHRPGMRLGDLLAVRLSTCGFEPSNQGNIYCIIIYPRLLKLKLHGIREDHAKDGFRVCLFHLVSHTPNRGGLGTPSLDGVRTTSACPVNAWSFGASCAAGSVWASTSRRSGMVEQGRY